MIELIGILAGIFVLLSFISKEQKKIRCINIIGCLLFITYGILIKSISIVFLNVSTLTTHIIYFYKEFKNGKRI